MARPLRYSQSGAAIRARERHFPWFLLATLLPILVMPFTNLEGNLAEKVCLPLVAVNLVVQSLRIMPQRPRQGPGPASADRLYQLLGGITAGAVWLPYLLGRHAPLTLVLINQLLICAFYAFTAARTIQILAQVEGVNGRTLCLGSAGYVQLGLTAGQLATALQLIQPQSFDLGTMLPGSEVVERLTYFCFITLGSIGYGDVLPKTPVAEFFTVGLSITGTLYISLIIGLLLSRYINDHI